MDEERGVTQVCPECGRSHNAGGDGHGEAVRCDGCFEAHLRAVDAEFLRGYAEFGVSARQVVAEACLRTLVLSAPEHRKVLAVNILDQLVLTVRDFIGLYHAVKGRDRRPIVQSFLEFRLTDASAREFFDDVAGLSDGELLETLGLPHPEEVASDGGLSKKERRSLTLAVRNALYGLRTAGNDPAVTERALLAAASDPAQTTALVSSAEWLRGQRLSADQVAALVIDPRRRTLNVNAVRVDEGQLGQAVDTIDIFTEAARDLAKAYLRARSDRGTGGTAGSDAGRGR